MECKRCGKKNRPVATITLLGNYIANLCIDCRNQWNQFIVATEEFKRRNTLEIEFRLAIQEKDRDWALHVNGEILENSLKLFELGKKWVEGKETK